MQFCEFSVQIDNYRAYATMPRKNLAQMTRTYEIILQKRQLSCKGIACDLRIYSVLIVDLMIWSSLYFAVFVFWFMFSAIVKVFRYFWNCTILWAKSLPISGRTGDLLRWIFEKFCVFPVNHLSENWITAEKRIFCHQYSPSTKFYSLYLIGHQSSHARVIFEI